MSQQDVLLRERLREAAFALRELRLERDALVKERTEPIAIVGIGCRFPGGANSPLAYWDLLAAGRDAVVPMEPRWKLVGAHPDEPVPRWAGLLTHAVETFDSGFFGISPREARSLDPQQRLLLEVSWEALEDAGIVPLSLQQSRTGVFIGACANDYADIGACLPPAEQDAYLTTGNMLSIAAGRLSYTLGLQGPCLTLDTACSSSLVAIHLACRSLRARESELALAGGVSLILSPDSTTALWRTQALSPDGRCRTFDALANGYVRGEGCGLVVLKRLSDAQRDGDRIWAVIRGSAINQDGRSTGLTAPNVLAQEALLREALKDAGVEPEAIGYVETHGTGTSLGDPIEVEALRAVLGKPRAGGGRCVLGAVKTNIGHLEGAAGVAGVIKAALALAQERIPKNLNLRVLNAHIELANSSLDLATEPREWPRGEKPRFAGVSSFGLSGTNAHVVLEEAPAAASSDSAAVPAVPAVPVLLSGRSEAALRAQAAQLGAYLTAHRDESLLDIAYTLACRRTHFEHRASIVVNSREELHVALSALMQGQPNALVRTAAARSAGKLAFLFTGQGSQRPAMGRALAEGFPRFRHALDAVLAALDPLLPRPLREVLFAEPGAPQAQLLDQTGYTQPALFALQVALFRFVESLGVTPDVLLGHSVGEIAAAHVAGVLSLADACRLVAARGRLMQELPSGGAMVALQAAEHEVKPLLAGKESLLDIAAINGPQHTVISGDEEVVLEVARHFESRGRKCTRLSVSHAFHSSHMDAMAEAFGKVVAGLSYKEPRIPLISSLTGELAADGEMSLPAYWVKQARATVRFQRGMATLDAAGVRSYLELGPRGVLCAMGAECLSEAAAQQSELVAVLRGEEPEPRAFMQALGRLHVRGIRGDFDALLRPMHARMVYLPTYPFQRQRCWIDAPRRSGLDESAADPASVDHPLLGTVTSLGEQDSYLFAGQLSASISPWLLEHRIFSTAIFPGTGFLDLALWAAQTLRLQAVAELVLSAPLTLSDSTAVQLQILVQAPDVQGARPFTISSRASGAPLQAPWVHHGTGVLGASPKAAELDAPAQWPPDGAEPVELSGLYTAFDARGLGYGPAYQGLRAVFRTPDAVYVHARLPDALHTDAARFSVHPALLDTTLHGLAAALPVDDVDAAVMLVAWQGVRLFASGALELRARLDPPTPRGGGLVSTSLVAWNEHGQPVLAVEQVTLQRVRAAQLLAAPARQLLHVVQWMPVLASASLPWPKEIWVLGGLSRLGHPRIAGSEELDERLQTATPPKQLVIDATQPAAQLGPLAAHERTHAVLRTLQACLQDDRLAAVELVMLTRGAVSTKLGEDAPALDQAPLWGLWRSARSEHPDRRLRLLDVEAGSDPEAILTALATEGEPELALRSGVLRAPRLAPLRMNEQTSLPVKAPLGRLAQGSVLITGGTGELATLLARHLVARYGARNLLLLSRRGMQAEGAAQLARELADHQAAVRIVSSDVSDPQALASVIQSIPDAAPLRAVFHCAAVLDDGVVSALAAERIDRVFAPKLDAAWHLHTLTQLLDLDAFVLFSSAAGILGAPGQANYAAANAFLDALAAHRRHRGLPGQSLAWGLWQPHGQGLAAKLTAADLARLQQQGVGMFSPDEGLAALDAALAIPEPLLVPMRLYGERLRALADVAPPLLRAITDSARPRAANTGAAGASQLPARLRALPADQRLGEVLELVRREVAVVLGLESGAALTPEQSLRDLGLDSLMAVELRNRVQARLGVRFELSTIWRLSNLRELAEELVRLLAPQTAPSGFAGAPAEKTIPAGRPRLAPMSAGQQRLYFLDRVLELRHTYNLALAIRLPASLDVAALRSAVEQLIARHEQLRVCFVDQDSQPRQRILPWVEPALEELSLTAGKDKRDAALREFVEREYQKPFELSRAPLFRLLYIRLGEVESALAIIWHHIATDGTSMSIFLAELSAAYQTVALRGGAELELAAGPSYALYAARQHEWLQTDACSPLRAFWKDKLEGLPALELPTDRTASRLRTERGGLVKFAIPAQTTGAIEALAKRLRSTPFVILSAAWSTLLARYSRQQDFAIGVTMAGRPDDRVRDAIGFFVNTLPLRCRLHGEPTGLEYIQRIHAEIWSALEHQELPLDEIVRVVAPDRQPGFIGSPLFRTCVSYNEPRWPTDSFAGLPAVVVVDPVIEKIGGASKFDLLLSVLKRPQGFAAALEFSTDLFDVATVERWAQHFITLLSGLVEQPERRLHELPLLTEAERQEMLVAWNDTGADYPRDACLHALFEAQVERSPDAVALVYGGKQLSYRALNAKANQLAARLRALDVGPDVRVTLCVERSLEMGVAILGILKAGGAYVPIDPDSPADRIDFMLQDTRPAALLTQRDLIEKLPRTSVPTLCLDDPETFAGQSSDNLNSLSTSANLAYVIYTSGSTGRPKGVLMEQHPVSNLLQALNRRAWGSAPLRAAMLAPIFFDMSVKPLFGSLLYGHTLYIVDKQTRRDGGALLSFFQRHSIAWSDCTPSILAMLVDAGLPTCQPLALQVLLCGGEALPTALVASLYAPRIHATLRVINVYGPTETCVNVNANPVTPQTLDASRAVVPMGRPFENTQLYVLDAHLQPVPVGVPGELHIGGVGLARGYLNRPELTAEKFIPNPFRADARVYKTGDLVRYLPDGKIEFLGRIDHQVKIRGFRIELGEIEAVLASHPDVGSCVVMVREDDAPGDKRLVAYVVPQPGRSLPAEELRTHLAKLLPDYMLPAAFVILSALPLNRNGKVDRRALPSPAREHDDDSFVRPAHPLERALADIFSSVLKRNRIGRNDDFFAMGGDSLLAVRAVTRAQQAGFALTVNQLFRSPTIAKLYAEMSGSTRATCMMMLQEGQEPGGILLVPGAGGVFHRPHDIARALEVNTPIFSLISPTIGGVNERLESVVDLAAFYAQDILERVPQGPLVVIGYSFGGAVALEIAEALSTMNRAVERVILLETGPSVKDSQVELDARTALDAILDTLGIPLTRVQGSAHEEPLVALTTLLAPDLEEAQGLHAFFSALLGSAQAATRMLGAWQPRLPNVPIHLLRVEGNAERGADYGWSQHGALASVKTIPGQHYSILRPPYLATTMQAVRSLLDRSRLQKS